jgi:antitoxin PrlF
MRTAISKLTKKYQATIPGPVRKVLHLKAGDSISFDIDGEDIRLRKARAVDMTFTGALEGTLTEWESEADEEAYREL